MLIIPVIVVVVLVLAAVKSRNRATRRLAAEQARQQRDLLRAINPAAAVVTEARNRKQEDTGIIVRVTIFGVIALTLLHLVGYF
jgi:hypothetical protein